jgi:hypothetical protein
MSKGPQLNGKITGEQEILSREQTLQILSEIARAGSVTAAIALERALRLAPGEEDDDDDLWAELDVFRPTRQPRPRRPDDPSDN